MKALGVDHLLLLMSPVIKPEGLVLALIPTSCCCLMRDLGDLLYGWGVCIERPTQGVLSNPVNDVSRQISVDPTHHSRINVKHLEQGRHVGVPGTTLKMDTSAIHHSSDRSGQPISGRCLTISSYML